MLRDTKIQLVTVVIMIGCLLVSGVLAVQISASAGRNKLVYAQRAEDGDPPQVALGIAMGAFRGLFVNFLWMRANNLKEEGKYYEAIDLASAITKLQPRFPQVWAFHAWNMAYNISVATHNQEERWNWVQAGIRLLRDEGIRANPNNLLLHKELAWIYLHKVQGYTDDVNPFYKRMVAGRWHTVLGPPPPPNFKSRDRAVAIEEYVQWLTPIADAPDTMEQLKDRSPNAYALAQKIYDGLGIDLNEDLLMRYEAYRAVQRSGQKTILELDVGERYKGMAALIEDDAYEQGWTNLLAFVRRGVLIVTYKMEPDRMVRYTRKYGPLDWRHPATHGLYWGARGVEEALLRVEDQNESDFDFINTDRMVIHSVQELWRSGELSFNYLAYVQGMLPYYQTMPNPHYIDSYQAILGELVSRSRADSMKRVYSSYAAGYENFIIDVIMYYFRRGQSDLADKYLRHIGTWEGENRNDMLRAQRFAKPVAEFVRYEMRGRYTSPQVARADVTAGLEGAYYSGLYIGDDEMFHKQFEFARQFHRYYFEDQGRQNILSPIERMAQMPKDFRVMAGGVFLSFMQKLDIDDAERVFDRAPRDLRRFAYDEIIMRYKEPLDELAKAGGRPFDMIFPEPDGMDQHRQWWMAKLQELSESDVNVKAK